MSDEVTERIYYLIESGLFEKLLKTHFMLAHTLLLFEHLCSHSDRPMFLRIKGVCEVLEITEEQLEACVLKQLVKPVVFQQQMMFSMYDVVFLSERLNRRKIQRSMSKMQKFGIRDSL